MRQSHGRTYAWCGDPGVDWASCDRIEGSGIKSGGFAAIVFERANQQGLLEGQVIATTNQGSVPLGSIQLQSAEFGTAKLISRGQEIRTLCGPRYAE
jgi:hypothetical protein